MDATPRTTIRCTCTCGLRTSGVEDATHSEGRTLHHGITRARSVHDGGPAGRGDELDPSKITPAMVELGRAIFHGKGSCFACHGAALEGTQIAPTLKTHAWRDAKNGDYAAIFGVITKGVSGTVMVAFPGGISKSEALSVASYVWQVGQQKAKP
jgi:mono/diheme cytochrome c family protein